jgi:FMN reductase
MSLGSRPFIVGIGGTTRATSSSEWAARYVLAAAGELGAEVEMFGSESLQLPMFAPENPARVEAAQNLVAALRRSDGIVIASPGYHGAISGLVKNALDYTEDLRDDQRPYFSGRAVASIACAAGPQAASTTLIGLRAIVHALRGWPTPLGVTINTSQPVFDALGQCLDPVVDSQLRVAAFELMSFATTRLQTEADLLCAPAL